MKTIALVFAALTGLSSSVVLANSDDITVNAVRDITPQYPDSALRRDLSGVVTVQFTLKDNKADEVEIVQAYPSEAFNSAVKTAVRKSVFEAENADGKPLANEKPLTVQRTYRFNLEGQVSINELAIVE